MELDAHEQNFVDKIAKHDCMIMNIASGADEDWSYPFSYTTGLFEKFQHPEIIVCGWKSKLSTTILNNMCDDIRKGIRRFEPGKRYDEVIADYDVEFIPIDFESLKEHFGWAIWYYRTVVPLDQPFPALQLVWPSIPEGAFPWDANWPEDQDAWQPLLGEREV